MPNKSTQTYENPIQLPRCRADALSLHTAERTSNLPVNEFTSGLPNIAERFPRQAWTKRIARLISWNHLRSGQKREDIHYRRQKGIARFENH